ncbi:MAG: prolipoprotein diacylglyceryl transferase [Bacteroidales bacterium]|jgi:prolipoprotein diacylglyceryl transferase|nr:prolipoprotein diacylglyceryl transferase [Bacteroidales bacterium]
MINLLAYIIWNVSPRIFSIGSLDINWYGLLFATAFVVGFLFLKKAFKNELVPTTYLDSLAVYVFLGTFIGARLGHCLFYEPAYYLSHPLEMILPVSITENGWKFTGYRGLASHGAAIGIQIAIWLHSKKTKLPALWSLDRLVMVVALAGLFIRTGNLFNSEIYGNPTTLPWGFIFVKEGEYLPKHPTQIYEAIAYLFLFILLWIIYRKGVCKNKNNDKAKTGVIFGIFLIVLFLTRFLIEFVKEPQEIWEKEMILNMGQILSIPFILEGIVILWLSFSGKIKNRLDISKLQPQKHKK